MRISEREAANKALDALLGKRDNAFVPWVKTRHLLSISNFNQPTDQVAHQEFRNVLTKLYNCGLVDRRGNGSFQWKLRDEYKEWNRNYPFEQKPTSPALNKTKEYTDGSLSATPTSSWKKPMQPAVQTYDTSHLNGQYVKKTEYDEHKRGYEEYRRNSADLNAGMLKVINESYDKIKHLEKELEEWKHVAKSSVRTLEIRQFKKTVNKIKDVVLPKTFDRVRGLCEMRRNCLLVGPAGCGKTFLAELVAKTLGLQFGAISLTAGISETHLLGRVAPNMAKGINVFQGSSFLDCFETGGLFLLDELDAADPNVLLSINTALANGYCNVPNRRKNPRAERHEDFVCVGTANTFGKGANRMYSGRNQLDEATLDRFRIGIVECEYDPAVEVFVCPDEDLRQTLQKIRAKIEQATGLRRIMSTRFMADAYIMVSRAAWDKQTVLDQYFQGWSDEEKAKVAF